MGVGSATKMFVLACDVAGVCMDSARTSDAEQRAARRQEKVSSLISRLLGWPFCRAMERD